MPAANTSLDSRRAALWRHFAGMVYDVFPLLALWIIGSGLWMLAFHRGDNLTQLAASLQSPIDRILRDLWLLLLAGAYFVLSWVRVGATVGMRAWRLRVVAADGGRIGVATACRRCVLAVLSLAALGCGFWYAWFDAEHRTWHDRMCGTHVVRW